MTEPSVEWEKLARYLAGESSPDEAAIVRRWLEEHPSDARVIAALDAATRKLGLPTSVDVEQALRRVKARARARSVWRQAAFAAAAAVVLAAGLLVPRDKSPDVPVVASPVTVMTRVGERDSVTLADGSKVLLGPDSRIVVRDRDVELTGEAYFSVVHDASRPFTVRAGIAVIRDIGTEFTVHSDSSGAGRVRVVVREGAVQLSYASDSVTLSPGDVGLVQESGRIETSRGAATDDDLAWTRGQLVFRNASVGEVAADLRRWYGVELRVTDSSLRRRHFTGSFATEPAERVLDVIALALGARVERRADTAYLRPALPAR